MAEEMRGTDAQEAEQRKPAAPAKPTAPPIPEPSDPGEIRISPQGSGLTAEQAQLNIADSFYARKMYDMAAPEYQRYVELFPNGPARQTALFRLAESYRQMGATNAAKSTYDILLSQYHTGDFIGPAAYRLADLYYQSKNYSSALPLYRKASVRLREPAVANASKFYSARCMEALGQKLDARMTYEEVAEIKENNPFQDASRLSLALLLKEGGRTTDALKQIQQLAKQTENAELKAEATVRTGMWQLYLEQPAKAAESFREALKMPGIGRWKEVAQVGLLRMLYDSGKYKQLLDTYQAQAGDFSAETKPELLLLVANSQRQLGKHAEAREAYEQILKEYPSSVYAKEAAYERLVSLYNADDPNLLAEIDTYVAGDADADKRDQVLLMKAEALFKKQDYAAAAPLYAQVTKSRQLNGTLRAEALFRLGWSSMQIGDLDRAIEAFSELLDRHPTHKSLPYALVQRAIAYQNQKKLTEAERDFTDLIRKYPKAKERELALQQKALIRGQMNDNKGMSENFQILLRDYPKSAAAAQAHYWIGWAAYEAKDYKKAAENLEAARKLDKEQFFERASLRVILSHYYLEDLAATAREVDLYSKEGKAKVPPEVLRWLGDSYFKASQPESAHKYLAQLASREEALPKDRLLLGQALLKAQEYGKATEALENYLSNVKEPPSRALGLLELTKAQIGQRDFPAAQKSVDQALTLQPEGKISGEARIAAGDIQAAQENYLQAAKLYESVSLILDDEEITPRALEKAVNSYRKAGEEETANKTLNRLQSRYPEYWQKKMAK